MISEINSFTAYLQEVKHTAKNTEVSYHRDLLQMAGFMEEMGITQVEKVTKTSLNSYILYLEKEGKKRQLPFPGNWRPSRHFSAILLRKER